ncbi:MAG: hypothetical protein WDA22_03080 [Bacteroidota bacterium]
MRKLNIVFFSTATFFFLSSCQEYSTGSSINGKVGFVSERSPYVLDGKVVDVNNIPVVGAEIHYMFMLHQSSPEKTEAPNRSMLSITISFSISKDGWTSLRIYRLGSRELIATLTDTVLQAGMYSRTFDAGRVTNGLYVYQLISDKIFEEKLFYLLHGDMESLLKTRPLAKTDVEGKFRLPQSFFGLDEEFTVTNEKGSVIGKSMIDSIGIVVYQNAKHPLVQWMNITKNRNMEATFTLQ